MTPLWAAVSVANVLPMKNVNTPAIALVAIIAGAALFIIGIAKEKELPAIVGAVLVVVSALSLLVQRRGDGAPGA